MRFSRVLLLVAAAMLCIAASGGAKAGVEPRLSATATSIGTATPAGNVHVETNRDTLTNTHDSLSVPPGVKASVGTSEMSMETGG